MSSLINALEWRYATKKMNGNVVPEDKINTILRAAQLAPTSSGIQPFKIFVITDPELKAKIQPVAFGQSQIVDASHVLVFAAWDQYTEERLKDAFDKMNTFRGLPLETTDDYRNQLWSMYSQLPIEAQASHTAKQTYISLGMALTAAAMEEVDATPMEGFNNAGLDELLGLEALGLKSTLILTLGYRDSANDWLVNLKKFRREEDDLFIKL